MRFWEIAVPCVYLATSFTPQAECEVLECWSGWYI